MQLKQKQKCWILLVSLLSWTNLSFAVDSIVPASVLPGRVEQPLQIPTNQLPRPGGPRVATPEEAPAQVNPEAAKIKFKLNGIQIQGNTVYTQGQLYYLFKDYLNREVSLLDLQNIARSITLKYRNDGYILSKAIIPPQKVTSGVVIIQVVEGYVDKVTVEGDARVAKPLIQAYGNKVACYRPFNIKVLERYVLLSNDLPGVSVRAVLKPSTTTPGAADVVLVGTEKYYNAYTDYNNRGTLLLGPQQFSLGGGLNEMLRAGDNSQFRYSTVATTQELQFYEVLHSEQVGSEGLQFLVDAYYTHSQPGSYLEPLDIDGKSYSIRGDLNFPFIRSRSQNMYFNAALKYLKSRTTTIGPTVLFDDRIYDFILGSSYELVDHYRGVNRAGFIFTQGLPIFNANRGDNPPPSRQDAANNFTKLNLNLSRLQALPYNFSVYVMGMSQYAFNSLYSSEQFGVGGLPIGSAYDPSEIVGDQGASGRGEIRYNVPVAWKYLDGLQLYGFYDGGIIWNKNSQSQPDRQSITGTGGGVRTHIVKYVDAYLEWAQPLTKTIQIVESDQRNGYAPRVFFGITARI